MVIFNPFYIRTNLVYYTTSLERIRTNTRKKKKLERDLVRTFSRAGEQLRVLRASCRRYFVRPGGAAKLAGPGTERPARRQRRVGKKIPSPPLPRSSSALPSASSRSCPCRRTSLSLSSRLVLVRALASRLSAAFRFCERFGDPDLPEFNKRLALSRRKNVFCDKYLLSGASGS